MGFIHRWWAEVPKEVVMAEEIKLPPEEEPVLPPAEEAKLIDELRKMEYEPLLPIEKKLISWSLIIGVVSLGFLVWVSYTFFPSGH
jgi:hypothetical protein